MAEYIDRDLTEQALMERCNETGYGGLNRTDVKMVMRTPWRIPTADVVERKHGKWETAYLDQQYAGCRPSVIYCSNCHIVSAFKTPFCPNCGADMRGREDGLL